MAGNKANRTSRIIQQRAQQFIQAQTGPKWKRELVQDHKWDYIDVDEFRRGSCYNGLRYLILFCSIIVSVATYIADIWTAVILLAFDQWSLSVEPKIPLYISKWIYVACIALSFLLLAWDFFKFRKILKSQYISLSVTNVMAYRYHSVKNFGRFCLFRKINSSRKSSDSVAFFVFYTLKGWKKLLFAQSPRQIIAAFTVAALLKSAWTVNGSFHIDDDWDAYGKDWQQRVALILMGFTCLIWALSMIELFLACILYIPVFCQIQGNLKEYCCHKIDKRITEILEKQRRKRLREQEKRAAKAAKKMRKGAKDTDDFQLLSTAEEDHSTMYDDTRPLKTAAAEPYRGDVKLEIAPPPEPVYEPASYYNNYSSPSFHHQHQPHSYYNDEPYYEMQQYPSSSPYQPPHRQQWPPTTASPAPPTPVMSSPYTPPSTTLTPSTPYSYTTTTISSPSPGYRAAGPVPHPNHHHNNYF